MKVLALYLKEDIEKTINGKKKVVHCMPATDRAICMALEKKGHAVTRLAYDTGGSLLIENKYDAVFNLCDGLEDDMDFIEFRVLKDLEKSGIPFTGNSLKAVMLCNDKRKINDLLVKNGILTPKCQVFKSADENLCSDLSFPLIVKPVCADSAVGIYADSVVNNEKNLRKNIRRVLVQHKQPAALVSEYIAGRDLTIPVMGKKNVAVFDPAELKYVRSYSRRPHILSHSAKWAKGKPICRDCITLVKNADKRFSREELDLIKSTAKKVYSVFGCDGYATVDARLDKQGRLFVIEINPNCWIGPKSDTARTLQKNYGLSFPDMVDRILQIALEK